MTLHFHSTAGARRGAVAVRVRAWSVRGAVSGHPADPAGTRAEARTAGSSPACPIEAQLRCRRIAFQPTADFEQMSETDRLNGGTKRETQAVEYTKVKNAFIRAEAVGPQDEIGVVAASLSQQMDEYLQQSEESPFEPGTGLSGDPEKEWSHSVSHDDVTARVIVNGDQNLVEQSRHDLIGIAQNALAKYVNDERVVIR